MNRIYDYSFAPITFTLTELEELTFAAAYRYARRAHWENAYLSTFCGCCLSIECGCDTWYPESPEPEPDYGGYLTPYAHDYDQWLDMMREEFDLA